MRVNCTLRVFGLLGVTAIAIGCSSVASPVTQAGFNIVGNPEATTGAKWTFRKTVDGVDYDLSGILYKPTGPGPFPAVILSHGSDGSAEFLGAMLAPVMVQWGLVCIGTNYTHSSGVPIGSPGGASELGASHANVLRAHMTYELLARLGYVDMSRIAAHGHSMGAYVNAALLGAYPNDFRAASATGGGVRPGFIVRGPAPSPSQAQTIRTPYQFHHGDADTVVPLSYDQRFDSLLTANGVEHQFYVYPGADHLAIRAGPVVLQHVRDWYAAHGMFSALTSERSMYRLLPASSAGY
jgi:dienelactone hydrolase